MTQYFLSTALCAALSGFAAFPAMADDFGARFGNVHVSAFEDPVSMSTLADIAPAAGESVNALQSMGAQEKNPEMDLVQELQKSEEILEQLDL